MNYPVVIFFQSIILLQVIGFAQGVCEGRADHCEYYYYPDICEDKGCKWHWKTGGRCAGQAGFCHDVYFPDECVALTGCLWNHRMALCQGFPLQCDDILDCAFCKQHANCTFWGGKQGFTRTYTCPEVPEVDFSPDKGTMPPYRTRSPFQHVPDRTISSELMAGGLNSPGGDSLDISSNSEEGTNRHKVTTVHEISGSSQRSMSLHVGMMMVTMMLAPLLV